MNTVFILRLRGGRNDKVSSLGYPRLGENREWKKLIEAYWAGKVSKNDLFAGAKELRLDFLKTIECRS